MKKLLCILLVLALGIAGTAFGEQPATQEDEDNTVLERVVEFFSFWRQEDFDGMLDLCSPAWKSGKDNVKKELFYDLGTKTPLEYYPVTVVGLPDDGFRSVVIDVRMDPNNGRDPSTYRLTVSMLREDGQWYVDPETLRTGVWSDAGDVVPDYMEDQEEVIDLALKYCSFWQQKDYDSMKELCAPNWQKEWDKTRDLLDFYMPGIPVAYEFYQLEESGTDVCRVKLKVTMEFLHNGTDPVRFTYIMPFDMTRINGAWYVEPVSIQHTEAFEDRSLLEPESTIVMAQHVLAFFSNWSRRDYDAMLGLCSPAWQETQSDIRQGLLFRLGTGIPTDFRSMSVSEITEVDTCYVQLDVMINPNNGKDPELRHCVVLMVWEDGMWCVDPNNIRFTETVVTEQPAETPEAEDTNG